MVGRGSLKAKILVRFQVPQPRNFNEGGMTDYKISASREVFGEGKK